MTETFDYVIVGGGSAGCIVAGQLSSDPNVRVLLLECGDPAEDHPETLRADGYKDTFLNDRLIWERFSVPQAGCNDKPLFMGSGRGLGGSGSVDGMAYLRGSVADFAMWGTRHWTWSDVVPDYEALERTLQIERRSPTAFTETCINAARAVGFERKQDLNDGTLQGYLGYAWMNYRGEARRSSYIAFLQPHLQRPNLVIETRVRATGIVFDAHRRAVAIEYIEGDRRHRAAVRRELVLSMGALETPKLLMLSGVGPGPELRKHGIPVVLERDEVGCNFQDHPSVTLFFRGKREVDCHYPQLYGFHRANRGSSIPAESADTCYVFYPARSSLREAMMRMLPTVMLPQSLYQYTPLPHVIRSSVGMAFGSKLLRRAVERIYGIVIVLGKPESRGSVRLGSDRSEDATLLDPAYLTNPQDMETMLRAVEFARTMACAPALRQWGNRELFPGRMFARSPRGIERFIRNNVMTTYHYSGTCRMGEDAGSVVNERLQVRGVSGLRIADASVIPNAPVSALSGPSMLIGYRAARFIREDARG